MEGFFSFSSCKIGFYRGSSAYLSFYDGTGPKSYAHVEIVKAKKDSIELRSNICCYGSLREIKYLLSFSDKELSYRGIIAYNKDKGVFKYILAQALENYSLLNNIIFIKALDGNVKMVKKLMLQGADLFLFDEIEYGGVEVLKFLFQTSDGRETSGPSSSFTDKTNAFLRLEEKEKIDTSRRYFNSVYIRELICKI